MGRNPSTLNVIGVSVPVGLHVTLSIVPVSGVAVSTGAWEGWHV